MSQPLIMKLIVFLAITAVYLPSLQADKGPTDLLADRADAVAVGEIQSGQQTGSSLTFVLSIDRTIKGDLAAGTMINVSGTAAAPRNISASRSLRGQYGLWFLKKASGQWTFLPWATGGVFFESSGYLPLSKASSPTALTTASLPVTIDDQIAVEIVAALQGYTSPLQLSTLTWGLMGIGQSAVVHSLYHTLRAGPDPELRFIGVTGLLGGNEGASALAEIATNLDLVQTLRTNSFIVTAICGERNADPGAIQSLGKIASSSNPGMQQCAANALMYIHTRDALPFLAKLLDSADAKTREYAIQGLSRFVDNLPITTQYNTINAKALIPQGPAPYRTPETDKYSLSTGSLSKAPLSETEYLTFWKSWWTTMRDKLTTKPRKNWEMGSRCGAPDWLDLSKDRSLPV